MEIHLIAGLILSAIIGISLGLFGSGGSTIAVPVFVYIIGIEAHRAIGMSLAVVGATSLVGTGLHYWRGTVKVKTGILFSISGGVGAYFGSYITYLIPSAALLFLFAVLMVIVGLLMLIKRNGVREVTTHQNHGRIKVLLAGLVVGLLTGFFGVGGGFLVVPALLFFSHLSMRDAIGTSLMIVAINSGAGLIGHLRHGGFNPHIAVVITIIAIGGTLAGTVLSQYVSTVTLKKWFAAFIITVALFLLVKNHRALFYLF